MSNPDTLPHKIGMKHLIGSDNQALELDGVLRPAPQLHWVY